MNRAIKNRFANQKRQILNKLKLEEDFDDDYDYLIASFVLNGDLVFIVSMHDTAYEVDQFRKKFINDRDFEEYMMYLCTNASQFEWLSNEVKEYIEGLILEEDIFKPVLEELEIVKPLSRTAKFENLHEKMQILKTIDKEFDNCISRQEAELICEFTDKNGKLYILAQIYDDCYLFRKGEYADFSKASSFNWVLDYNPTFYEEKEEIEEFFREDSKGELDVENQWWIKVD